MPIIELVDAYPLIVTDSFRECRDFYGRWFGFEVGFEADWIVVMRGGGGQQPVTLAFMHSTHPSAPPTPAPFSGDGMLLTLQVADARAEYQRLAAAGMDFDLHLTAEPWGERRFAVIDPAGMWVDVVEPIEPAAGWWDPYLEP